MSSRPANAVCGIFRVAEMDGVTQARGRWPVDGGGLWVAC